MLSRLRRPRSWSFLTGAVLLAAVSGCDLTGRSESGGGTSASVNASDTSSPVGKLNALGDTASEARYRSFYQQKAQWRPCGSHLTCATVKVPLDWATPEKGTISLALNRRGATSGDRKGSILYNPGGPGASGVEFVQQVSPITDALAKHYDLVGFDPRGVGRSAPLDCLSDKELDAYLGANIDPDTPQGLAAAKAADKKFGDGCKAKSGAVLDHVDTWSAARDMDVIRAAVGDERLNYLGQSYGTLLGSTYAGFYPKRVGRLVLDGALDPRSTNSDVSLVQAQGFETNLRDYMKTCLSGETGDCPFTGSVDDGMSQIRQMLDKLEAHPIKVGDRQLVAPLAFSGIAYPLYGGSAEWPELSQAFAQLKQGDGSTLLDQADQYNSRKDNGSYVDNGNGAESFFAINCLDYPPTETTDAQLKAQARRVEKAAPTVGRFFTYSDVFCENYPVKAVRTPGRITANGSGPILVVGTTHDPATPYRWAQSLAAQLSNATLLTYEGDGHTAYNRESKCIDAAVDAYFLDGTTPGKGTKCTA